MRPTSHIEWRPDLKVYSVIVAYHPRPGQVEALCRALRDSGSRVVVVDNTEVASVIDDAMSADCEVIRLGRNTGIAHAQNVGIDAALAQDADVIAFFDQDSQPDVTFLPTLMRELQPGIPRIVAPVCVDSITGQEMPSFRMRKSGLASGVTADGHPVSYPVDLVISSGSAVTAITFSIAGKMDEDFFIDYVDFEYCLRCRSANIPIIIVPSAVMRHSIGERVIGIWPLRGVVHGPGRSYYKIRNCFLLFRKRSVPWLFAFRETVVAIVRHIGLMPFVSAKKDYFAVLIAGVWHGITDVRGVRPTSFDHDRKRRKP
jgi:rhamnosyltransferase